MSLSKQKSYSRDELLPYFATMYGKKLERASLADSMPDLFDWGVEAWMDGPLTFVVLTHPSGVEFTGWSKFNPNDNKYTEHGGLYRALQKAIDKYVDELAYRNTWGVSILDSDESLTKALKESTNEATSDQGSSGTDQEA